LSRCPRQAGGQLFTATARELNCVRVVVDLQICRAAGGVLQP
jgi:hypothetical protein